MSTYNSAEQSFAKITAEKGLHESFLEYAAEEAVLMRNNALVVGKEPIGLFL